MARKTSKTKRKSTKAKTTKRRAATRKSILSKISKNQKQDFLGISLTVLGLLLLISFFTSQEGNITGEIVKRLYQIAGYGAYLFPFISLAIGIMIIFRNNEKYKRIPAGKIIGVIFLYLNLVTWIHFFTGGGWQLAKDGGGGGYLGAFFEGILDRAVGKIGTGVVLFGWLLMSVVLSLNISIPELFTMISNPMKKTGKVIKQSSNVIQEKINKKEKEAKRNAQRTAQAEGFTPIGNRPKRRLTIIDDKSETVEKPDPKEKVSKKEIIEPVIKTGIRANQQSIAWKLPSIASILNKSSNKKEDSTIEKERARIIEETLASFGAPAQVVEIHRGPTFTQFGVEPDFIQTRNGSTRVRVSKITALSDDLALALAAQRIRVQAPVPGKHYIGIEVPNAKVSLVTLREGMESSEFKNLNSPLRVVLGENVAGKPIAVDLRTMPHLLIAGTTGSGKSVCINAIISCLLMQRTPEELRMVMVDPKRVELTGYNKIPHLLTPVVVEPEKVIGILRWISREMDSRYHKFAEVGVRNIMEYNKRHQTALPYIVVIIDELADLMMLAPDETERNLNRLAQLARATGIHLVIATQRPSVDVITGMIKANFPARISFSVVSSVDSRVILDQSGAERLIGKGDMLFQAPDEPAPKRLQGVFLSENEIHKLVQFWQEQAEELKSEKPEKKVESKEESTIPVGKPLTDIPLFKNDSLSNEDPMLEKAIEVFRDEDKASVSMLQRKLRIGYTRAARIVDRLEEMGIIGEPASGSGIRPVLIKDDE